MPFPIGKFQILNVVSDAVAGAFRGVFYDFASRQQINAGGTLGYTQVTANQTPITAIVDLTGLTRSINVMPGRRILISSECIVSSTVATDTISLFIYDGAAQVQQANITASGGSQTMVAQVVLAPTSGVHTYKLRMSRSGGTGNVTMTASATIPAFILVEDVAV